jgi:hypothetical protein
MSLRSVSHRSMLVETVRMLGALVSPAARC